jgi:hypothetical protein
MCLINGHAARATSQLLELPLERVEAIVAHRDDWTGSSDGSVIVVLMCISILVNVARLVMDHCWDHKQLLDGAKRPRPLMRRYVHRVMRRYCLEHPQEIVSLPVTPAQLADALLNTSEGLSVEQLCAVIDEETG